MTAPGRKARLVYVVPGHVFAGVEHVVHAIASQLTRVFGHLLDVHVLYFSRFAEVAEVELGYTAHFLDNLRMRDALGPLRRFFRALTPDIIIVAQCEMTALCFLATGFNKADAVFIVHLHGNPVVERATSLRSRVLFAFYDRLVAPALAGVLAVSEDLATEARSTIAAGRPVYFAPNPLRSYPGANTHRLPDASHRFLNVARLSRQKGQDILLRAFPRVRAALPGATLALVGAGPDEAALKALAGALDLEDCVTFHGHQSDPSTYFKAATCFVFPSRWEGFGLALVEALSFGLPVVASACSFGPRELITDDRIGFLAPVGDEAALASAMIEAARAVSASDSIAMRRAVAARFALPNAAAAHFDAIRQLANRGEKMDLLTTREGASN